MTSKTKVWRQSGVGSFLLMAFLVGCGAQDLGFDADSADETSGEEAESGDTDDTETPEVLDPLAVICPQTVGFSALSSFSDALIPTDVIWNGEAYFVGAQANSDGFGWLIKKSVDAESWSTVDDYAHTSGYGAAPHALLSVSEDVLIACGFAMDNNYKGFWTIRRSEDGGNTWATTDSYQYISGKKASCEQLAMTTGAIYAVGYANQTDTHSKWVVRKSVDEGETWTTVDSFDYESNAAGYNYARGVYASGDQVWVAGSASQSPYNHSHMLLRSSSDGGATWSTSVDSAGDADMGAGAFGLNHLTDGLFLNGYVVGDSWAPVWSVLRTEDGSTWDVLDEFDSVPDSTYESNKAQYCVDSPSGDLVCAGWIDDGVQTGVFRGSLDRGATWSTLAEVPGSNGNLNIYSMRVVNSQVWVMTETFDEEWNDWNGTILRCY